MGELSSLFAKYGYWAVFFGVLLEDAGLPLPGETILLYASFLAHSKHELQLPYVILIAIIAATMGDNIGYGLGRYGGRPLLDRYKHIFHISPEIVARGERLMERYGALAVFFGRFITGLRILAGPLAGTLHMSWKKFAIFNFLGAAAWVTGGCKCMFSWLLSRSDSSGGGITRKPATAGNILQAADLRFLPIFASRYCFKATALLCSASCEL
jgi:membrane protein DedA with SNARE-associated domain